MAEEKIVDESELDDTGREINTQDDLWAVVKAFGNTDLAFILMQNNFSPFGMY